MKRNIFNIIQIGDKSNRPSRIFDVFITVVILTNIVITFLQTFDSLNFLSGFFNVSEIITILDFQCGISAAYLDCRLSVPSEKQRGSPIKLSGFL